MKASVCICTYNGSSRLPAVFECLARQTEPAEGWEIIVVDNASRDDTAAVVRALIAQHGMTQARVVHEPEPGLSFARRRAALEAQGKIVCFLDDDNLAEPDFVATATRLFAEQPKTGSLGGKVLAEWESEPTALVRAVAGFALALQDHGDTPYTYTWIADGPVGAGLCMQRELLVRAFNDPTWCAAVTGRQGESLAGGEDMALAVWVYQAGYDRRYEPSLCLRHQLPARRMTRDYLLRLYEGTGRGQAAVRRLWVRHGDRRLMALAVAAKDFLLWLQGLILGTRARTRLTTTSFPPGAEPVELRRDLHALQQSLLRGRVTGALAFAFSKPRRPRPSA